jgi:hypothetical protein
MTNSLLHQLNASHKTAERKRYVRNLAESLMAKARIPDGRHLVAIIGTGMERSNAEALATWVERTMPIIGGDALKTYECLESLAKHLEARLLD